MIFPCLYSPLQPVSRQDGVEKLLVTSCYRNWDKLQPDEQIDWYADFGVGLSTMCIGKAQYVRSLEQLFI